VLSGRKVLSGISDPRLTALPDHQQDPVRLLLPDQPRIYCSQHYPLGAGKFYRTAVGRNGCTHREYCSDSVYPALHQHFYPLFFKKKFNHKIKNDYDSSHPNHSNVQFFSVHDLFTGSYRAYRIGFTVPVQEFQNLHDGYFSPERRHRHGHKFTVQDWLLPPEHRFCPLYY